MGKKLEKMFILSGEHILQIKALHNAKESVLSYSIPQNYGEQAPLILNVEGEHLSYHFEKDNTNNDIIKFKIPALCADQKIRVKIDYLVITKRGKVNVKKVKMKIPYKSKIPKEAEKWLNPTKCIQSNNIFIKAYSRFLQGFSKDLMWYVKKVMFWNAYHGIFIPYYKKVLIRNKFLNTLFLPDKYWYVLEDAVSCLLFGAFCSGKANLEVAMFRSRKIPTRLLIALPLFYGKKFWIDGLHYLPELFVPGYGWIRTQSGKVYSEPRNNIILKIVHPKDENLAGGGLSYYGGTVTWFWFENSNLCFDTPNEFKLYKIPKSKKIGATIARGWKKKRFKIPKDISIELFDITKEVWDKSLNNHKKINPLQKKAIDLLLDSRFEEYIKYMKNI